MHQVLRDHFHRQYPCVKVFGYLRTDLSRNQVSRRDDDTKYWFTTVLFYIWQKDFEWTLEQCLYVFQHHFGHLV